MYCMLVIHVHVCVGTRTNEQADGLENAVIFSLLHVFMDTYGKLNKGERSSVH